MNSAERPPSFSLVDQPWIRVQYLDGDVKEVSLIGFFENAYRIKRLAHEDAIIDIAVFAMLEACFIRGFLRYLDSSEDAEAFFDDEGQVDIQAWLKHALQPNDSNLQPVLDYLNDPEIKPRFDLFHPEHPFMQVADLHTKQGKHSEASRIIFDSESNHFSIRAAEGKNSLTFADAARRLITAHAYDYSGIKSGAIGDPRVKGGKGYPIGTGWHGATGKVILHGQNMAETLLLNFPFTEVFATGLDEEGYSEFININTDLPVWERTPVDGAAQRQPAEETVQPTGVCDILTWQSRRIRLFPNADSVTGVLVSNGDKVSDKFIDGTNLFDPWTSYRYSKNQSKGKTDIWMPLQHAQERTLWKGIDALLAQSSAPGGQDKKPIKPRTFDGLRYFPRSKQVKVQLVGVVYGTQNAVIETTIDESLPIELALLTEEFAEHKAVITENAEKAVEASVRLGSLAGQLLVAAGKEYVFQADPTESALHRLEGEFREWLATISHESHPEELKRSWHVQAQKFLKREAERLIEAAPPKVHIGTLKEDNGKTVLTNAATAYRFYAKILKDTFPLAYPTTRKENPDEHE
ncbi:type I-E CRISPR-associated protein Cse1/CasA [Rothia aerolata]|uniref:CRISPR-associated protein CasA/Cse1 n=1 Tax=Rothia aerolata TaxID=1812262 RepID=A0A917IVN2_9MICC|nr:type I-E CRISPR-associated protein Cse1/CasA [Rothia aerolata]GGH64977.1 CRISPR-associated protein CasA/Cse1 [Rothia aerolata]